MSVTTRLENFVMEVLADILNLNTEQKILTVQEKTLALQFNSTKTLRTWSWTDHNWKGIIVNAFTS